MSDSSSPKSNVAKLAEGRVKTLLLEDKQWELVFPARQDSPSATIAHSFILNSNIVRKRAGGPELSLDHHKAYDFRICHLTEQEQGALRSILGNGDEYQGYLRAIISPKQLSGKSQCMVIIDDDALKQTQERISKEIGLGK